MVENVEAGDRQVSRRVVVNAPVSTVFELVVNPHRHHELDGSGTVGESISGPERLKQGDTFSANMRMFGMKYSTTSTATDVRDDAVVEWQVGAGQKWRWEMKSLGPNQTEVTETWDITEVPAIAALGMRLLGMYKRNAAGIEETLRHLQARFA